MARPAGFEPTTSGLGIIGPNLLGNAMRADSAENLGDLALLAPSSCLASFWNVLATSMRDFTGITPTPPLARPSSDSFLGARIEVFQRVRFVVSGPVNDNPLRWVPCEGLRVVAGTDCPARPVLKDYHQSIIFDLDGQPIVGHNLLSFQHVARAPTRSGEIVVLKDYHQSIIFDLDGQPIVGHNLLSFQHVARAPTRARLVSKIHQGQGARGLGRDRNRYRRR